MKIEVVANSAPCSGGTCPTIYKTDSGSFLFQGFSADSLVASLPDGESVVEIPKEVVELFLANMSK